VGGATIERKIRTRGFDNENEGCRASSRPVQHSDFSQLTPPFAIPSTFSAI